MDRNTENQQPSIDCDKLGRSTRIIAEQLQLLGTLPQIQDANSILQSIANLQAQMGERFDSLEAKVVALDTKVIALDTKVDGLSVAMAASRYNTSARQYNSQLHDPDVELSQLHHYETNALIPNFPATSGSIIRISGPNLIALLDALGEPSTGNVSDRRKSFRRAIGLSGVAV